MPFAESDGARIHYELAGQGEPLLLLMGYGLSGDAWTPMLPLLAGYRAVIVDNRGTGGSQGALEGITIDTFAGDAAAVLDAAAIRRAHVHGVSMGGMIAQSLVLTRPDLVHTLVLGCTTPAPLRFMADDGAASIELFQAASLMRTDPQTGVDRLLPLILSPEFLAENPSVRDMAGALVSAAPIDEAAPMQMMRAIADLATGRAWDVADRLGEIKVPTLVQHGSADRLIAVEAGRHLADHIPGAEYQEFEGAGHAYGLERPLEAFPRMMQFLAAHPLPG